jgi:secreted trypsin-like serine protease
MSRVIIVVTLLVLACILQTVVSNDPKIVNGALATDGQFPFIIQLFNKTADYNFCGGTSIGALHVLTAAHCVEGARANEIQIWAGALNINSNQGYKVNVDAIYQHKNYNAAQIKNDVAVIKLAKPFPKSVGVRAIEMATTNVAVGTQVTAVGWGSTSFAGIPGYGAYPEDLMFVKFDVVSTTVCERTYGSFLAGSQEVCAYDPNQGTCFGDSGGPLITGSQTEARQHGVTSYVSGSGCATAPSVFARVAYYHGWIVGKTNHVVQTNCADCATNTAWKQMCESIDGTYRLTASGYQCRDLTVIKTRKISHTWNNCDNGKLRDLCEKIGRYSCTNNVGKCTRY